MFRFLMTNCPRYWGVKLKVWYRVFMPPGLQAWCLQTWNLSGWMMWRAKNHKIWKRVEFLGMNKMDIFPNKNWVEQTIVSWLKKYTTRKGSMAAKHSHSSWFIMAPYLQIHLLAVAIAIFNLVPNQIPISPCASAQSTQTARCPSPVSACMKALRVEENNWWMKPGGGSEWFFLMVTITYCKRFLRWI